MSDTNKPQIPPPPVLCSARVIEYAILDDTVTYTGRRTLYVGGKELGPVPCLAILENLEGGHIYIAHCDESWSVLGASGIDANVETIESLKNEAEVSHRGVTPKWQSLGVSKEDAVRFDELLGEGVVCGFCSRSVSTKEELFHGPYGDICHSCVEAFHKTLSSK